LVSEGVFVVVEVGFVGRADFDELTARGFKDVGDAKASADFDEFGARDDDFVFFGTSELAQGDDEGRGTIVDDGGFFRAEESGESGFEVDGARAALSSDEVDFEVGIASGDVF